MRKKTLTSIVILTLSLSANTYGQISYGGTPKSFNLNKSTGIAPIQYIAMPKVNVEVLKSEDVHNDNFKDHPWRFGENLFVDYNPDNSGSWTNLPDGGRIWQLGITCKGALSINLSFNKYQLAEGAELFIYNSDKSVVLGKFNHKNNEDHGYLSTVPIPGESIIIEYFEPEIIAFKSELNLWRVTHGYRGVSEYAKILKSSQPCNINAACSDGDPIRNQIKSVAIIVTGGSGFCTGALINNTSYNETPYFLTANHCYEDPSSLVFWFNWQSNSCNNPILSPSYNSISGGTTRARYNMSDFWLIELNQTPPANYDVFYSGWDRSDPGSIPSKCWGIHHPNGDIKKICWANSGVFTDPYLDPSDDSYGFGHWRVSRWSEGTTEGGSSGSPLYDTDLRIIGQLHGGKAGCDDPFESDYYGKLSDSWTGGGSSNNRLSDWLDPNNVGVDNIDGYPLNTIDARISVINAPLLSYIDTTRVIPSFDLYNCGSSTLTTATVGYQIDNGTVETLSWTGSLAQGQSETVLFPELKLEYGAQTLRVFVTATDDEQSDNNELEIEISVGPFDKPQNLMAGVINNDDVQLRWNTPSEVLFYDDFESQDFSNWNSVIQGSGTPGGSNPPYWHIVNNSAIAYSGSYCASVDWGNNLNTWLISNSYMADVFSNLSFSWQSSYEWHVNPNDNGDLFVKISTDNGTTWETIWSFGNIGFWSDFVWKETTLSLSSYAGQNIQFAFNIIADDNEVTYLDNVSFGNTPSTKKSGSKAIASIKKENSANKVALVNYTIYRNNTEIGQTTNTTYTDADLPIGVYTYYVVANYTDPTGSSVGSDEVSIGVGVSSVEENVADVNSTKVYPNPSDGIIFIETDKKESISVLNINGQVLREIKLNPGSSEISLGKLGAGIYLLHFTTDKTSYTKKVFIR